METIQLVVLGIIIGVVTAVFKMPVPAPPVWQGVVGIVAITLAYQITNYFIGR
jgi:XapX domain-containing protein